MKYLDRVEVIAEKESYTKFGVHKGMQGVIWAEESIDGCRLVYFTRTGEKPDIGDIPVKETDLRLLSKMDAQINEEIEAHIRSREKSGRPADLSDYMV